MSKKKNPPCLRKLDRFRKSGCPRAEWDGSEGCEAWKTRNVPKDANNPTGVKSACIDILSEKWRYESLKLLEGNQQATESFRNGMCEEVDGQSVPKMDRAILGLVGILRRQKEDFALLKTQQPLEITE